MYSVLNDLFAQRHNFFWNQDYLNLQLFSSTVSFSSLFLIHSFCSLSDVRYSRRLFSFRNSSKNSPYTTRQTQLVNSEELLAAKESDICLGRVGRDQKRS